MKSLSDIEDLSRASSDSVALYVQTSRLEWSSGDLVGLGVDTTVKNISIVLCKMVIFEAMSCRVVRSVTDDFATSSRECALLYAGPYQAVPIAAAFCVVSFFQTRACAPR